MNSLDHDGVTPNEDEDAPTAIEPLTNELLTNLRDLEKGFEKNYSDIKELVGCIYLRCTDLPVARETFQDIEPGEDDTSEDAIIYRDYRKLFKELHKITWKMRTKRQRDRQPDDPDVLSLHKDLLEEFEKGLENYQKDTRELTNREKALLRSGNQPQRFIDRLKKELLINLVNLEAAFGKNYTDIRALVDKIHSRVRTVGHIVAYHASIKIGGSDYKDELEDKQKRDIVTEYCNYRYALSKMNHITWNMKAKKQMGVQAGDEPLCALQEKLFNAFEAAVKTYTDDVDVHEEKVGHLRGKLARSAAPIRKPQKEEILALAGLVKPMADKDKERLGSTDELSMFSCDELRKMLNRETDVLKVIHIQISGLAEHEVPGTKAIHMEDLRKKIETYREEIARREKDDECD